MKTHPAASIERHRRDVRLFSCRQSTMSQYDAAPPNTHAGGNDEALRPHGTLPMNLPAEGDERVDMETYKNSVPLWKRIHQNSLTQMILMSVQAFCGPAMADAIAGKQVVSRILLPSVCPWGRRGRSKLEGEVLTRFLVFRSGWWWSCDPSDIQHSVCHGRSSDPRPWVEMQPANLRSACSTAINYGMLALGMLALPGCPFGWS